VKQLNKVIDCIDTTTHTQCHQKNKLGMPNTEFQERKSHQSITFGQEILYCIKANILPEIQL